MRKIALITTSRADYGIQARLAKMLQADADLDFHLIVSGTHLSAKHGYTVKEIERDGVAISARVDIGIDDAVNVPQIMAKAIMGFSEVLTGVEPEICVLLGDRFEMFAAATACTLCNIPVAHLHGGEATQGAHDEAFRHSITKMAHLHFTSCEEYRRRVIQLGENPNRVFNVGALGVENVHRVEIIPRDELVADIGIVLRKRNFLVTFHPVTFDKGAAGRQADELLAALSSLDDATIIFTHPNADAEGDDIVHRIAKFVEEHDNAYLFSSLGARRYLSLVKCVDAVVGNSSSGIIEVPSLRTATVNIGDREGGRIRAESVVDCKPDRQSITAAISTVLSDEFREKLKTVVNPYDKAGTASAILEKLKSLDTRNILKKKFYDTNWRKPDEIL